MSKFDIEIEEISQRVVQIEANNLEEALEVAEEQYLSGEIVLDYNDFKEHETREYRECVREEDIKKDAILNINIGQVIVLEGDKNLALVKRLNCTCQPYVIARNIMPNQNTHTYFDWAFGTYFDSLANASKEFSKKANNELIDKKLEISILEAIDEEVEENEM